MKIAIVVSKYNASITDRLLAGALETLLEYEIPESHIDIARVPGAWEISVATAQMARTRRYQAVICLGAVIKGETTHDQYINQQVSHSLGQISLECGIPISFGLLTCNTVEQAINRAGGSVGNKGRESVLAALEMIDLLRNLPSA
jgi:6,7-dimethyl-8-ribityllumazine synthase